MQGIIEKRVGARGTSYRVLVEFPPDPVRGERRRRSETFKTKKAAGARRAEWVSEIEKGTAVNAPKMTVSELFAMWLDALRMTNPKPRTITEYERVINGRIISALGSVAVQNVTPLTVDAFYAQLKAGGASDDAVHRVHKRLRQAFDYAVRKRLLAVNPMLAVDAPTVRSKPRIILTAGQMARFVEVAEGDGYSPLWLVILQTGLRRGEALGLRWADVDLLEGRLQVRQCGEALDGAAHVTTPRTAATLRTITLFAESVSALKAHRDRLAFKRQVAGDAWRETDLVFCTPEGGPLDPNNVLRNLAVIQRRATASGGEVLPKFDIHGLRHMHATHLLQDGWPVPTVSRRLGHANPSITMTTYANALTDIHGEDGATPAAFAFATGT